MKSTGSLRAASRRKPRWATAALVTLALVATSGGAVAAESETEDSAKESKSEKVTSRPDRVSAMSTAQAQKSRVEDLSAQTESSSSFANPDGSWTTETFAGPARVRDKNGELAPLDTDLVHENGSISAPASTDDVTLSDGGEKTMGTLQVDGEKSVGIKVDDEKPASTNA